MPRRTVYHLLFTPFQVEVIKRRWPGPAQARTYLLRLMRDRGVDVPAAAERPEPRWRPGTRHAPGFRVEITGWEPRRAAEWK